MIRYLLAQTDYAVVNVDALTYAGNLASLAEVEASPRYRFAHLNLQDVKGLRRLLAETKPVGILHLAAESHVDRSIEAPAIFAQTNVVGTLNLLQATMEYWRGMEPTAATDFRFLHVSTDEVFGTLDQHGPSFTEASTYAPRSPYAASKAGSDHLVRAWGHTFGLPVLVTHGSNNYGPFQFPEKLIPTVILKAQRGEPIPVYGQGEQVRDWLYVEDHARALVAVLERGTVGESYVIGGGEERRNVDLVREVCALLDATDPRRDGAQRESLITFVEDRPGHDFRYALDSTKMRSELGWAPQATLTSGLRRTVAWYLENSAWWQPLCDRAGTLDRLGRGASTSVTSKP